MTTISTEQDVVTLVNVFAIKPEDRQRFVNVLAGAAPTTKRIHSYVSSNVHKAVDANKTAISGAAGTPGRGAVRPALRALAMMSGMRAGT